jgi:hypothetical protein
MIASGKGYRECDLHRVHADRKVMDAVSAQRSEPAVGDGLGVEYLNTGQAK